MFKTFPEFSKLTLADRDEYETLIKDYPPIGDISFVDLMTWWNSFGQMAIAMLNDNLVIPYWLPGDEKRTGLSLVGVNKVDESICTIFDHLKDKGEESRLINVPEFVIANVRYPEMFSFKEERQYNEYIFETASFYPLANMAEGKRKKVEKTLHTVGEESIRVESIDLRSTQNRSFLLAAASAWQQQNINNYGSAERQAIEEILAHPIELGVENICIFVHDELFGFCLYEVPAAKDHVLFWCIKATHKNALGFEFMAYEFAKWLVERGVRYGNLNSDYGLSRLRMFMLAFGPVNFVRKYQIEPA